MSGYTRSSLNNLILPCQYNRFSPPVKSISMRQPGKKKGIRLIVRESLVAYLRRLQG